MDNFIFYLFKSKINGQSRLIFLNLFYNNKATFFRHSSPKNKESLILNWFYLQKYSNEVKIQKSTKNCILPIKISQLFKTSIFGHVTPLIKIIKKQT